MKIINTLSVDAIKGQAKNGSVLYTKAFVIKEFRQATLAGHKMSNKDVPSPEFSLPYNSARFLQSGSKLSNCPEDSGIEIAFAGRSNAGKSSAINSITQNKKLARTSKTPGRTQLINFFSLSVENVRLVDLPGYGYAKVSLDMKEAWGRHLEDYLQNRQSLVGLVLIMDIRKPMTEFDTMLLDWSKKSELSTTILLTKADKLKFGPAKATLLSLKRDLEDHPFINDIVLFSSLKNTGIKEARRALDNMFSPYLADDEDQDETQSA